MHEFSPMLFHWLDNTAQLSQRVCVVLMIAYVMMRLEWLRTALLSECSSGQDRVKASFFFGIFAIISTHTGFVMDTQDLGHRISWPNDLSEQLKNTKAVIGFRGLIVMLAGLIGGPWVGFGAGSLAGIERYVLGGYAAFASGLATVLQGLWAGFCWQWRRKWTRSKRGACVVALVGTVLQKMVLLLLVQSESDASMLVMETLLPGTLVNTLGVFLFLFVLDDLQRDRLKAQVEEANLRAINAQIEPHFVNNVMSAIKSMINSDPKAARYYVVEMARYLADTCQNAKVNAIPLRQEVTQLKRYLSMNRLRFGDKVDFAIQVREDLLECYVPPRCLHTLVENALQHGMKGQKTQLRVEVGAKDFGRSMWLWVNDNGCGMDAAQLAKLGKRPIEAHGTNGNGIALFNLRQSLTLAFKQNASMEIASQINQGTEITINLPKRTEAW